MAIRLGDLVDGGQVVHLGKAFPRDVDIDEGPRSGILLDKCLEAIKGLSVFSVWPQTNLGACAHEALLVAGLSIDQPRVSLADSEDMTLAVSHTSNKSLNA